MERAAKAESLYEIIAEMTDRGISRISRLSKYEL
jgi:hypothetical protein